MKVGDLVTLSARALKTIALVPYKADVQEGKLIGMIIKIDRHHRFSAEHKYHIKWIGRDTPRSRSYYYNHTYFIRSDLKYVRRA